jgi:hypothetical protein
MSGAPGYIDRTPAVERGWRAVEFRVRLLAKFITGEISDDLPFMTVDPVKFTRVRLNFIVTYDIRCDKLRMEGCLEEVMNEAEDPVLFIELGPASQRGELTISALGQSYTKVDAPCFIA